MYACIKWGWKIECLCRSQDLEILAAFPILLDALVRILPRQRADRIGLVDALRVAHLPTPSLVLTRVLEEEAHRDRRAQFR